MSLEKPGDNYLELFVKTIKKKYPDGNIVSRLSEILNIDKSNVRRRLKGTTQLLAEEFIKICGALNISMDRFITAETEGAGKITFLGFDPLIEDQANKFLTCRIESYRSAHRMEDSLMMQSTAGIPPVLYLSYPALKDFFVLRWVYHLQKYNDIKTSLSEALRKNNCKFHISQYVEEMKNSNSTVMILFVEMLRDTIEDIKYYHSMKLLERREVRSLYENLGEMLNYLLRVTESGCWPENGNKIDLYISNILNSQSVTTVESSSDSWVIYGNDVINIFAASDPELVALNKAWIMSFLKTSDLVSLSGAKHRQIFFSKQTKYLDKLLKLK